jgi:hypothetical protein
MAVREFTGELEPLEIKKPSFREFTGEVIPLETKKPSFSEFTGEIVPLTAPVTSPRGEAPPPKPATSAVDQIPTGGITAPAPRPEDQSFLREVADVPLKIAGGVTTGIRLVADAFGADSSASKNIRGVENWIAELYSAQSKQDSKRMNEIMKEAEDKGVLDQLVAAGQAFKQAPIDLTVNALGTAAPAILASVCCFLSWCACCCYNRLGSWHWRIHGFRYC